MLLTFTDSSQFQPENYSDSLTIQNGYNPPYSLLGSSLTVGGRNPAPLLQTSLAGVLAEDAGIYSCLALDEGLQIVAFSSIEISVLRELCTDGMCS